MAKKKPQLGGVRAALQKVSREGAPKIVRREFYAGADAGVTHHARNAWRIQAVATNPNEQRTMVRF